MISAISFLKMSVFGSLVDHDVANKPYHSNIDDYIPHSSTICGERKEPVKKF
jgi:hypothetical protein